MEEIGLKLIRASVKAATRFLTEDVARYDAIPEDELFRDLVVVLGLLSCLNNALSGDAVAPAEGD
ncbi:hypothetical protein HMPREF7215_2561 [Pyramidobacter piscolens W5455]|uniref:Uncharacterized protein n=1 Tax=Pyramidobacter piscolens W5455 TaxID=352165 RepID=A0ABP2HS07_9BACT|nr:hypothetical protein HMPREF7215_2561 [Pyramidobacter piscolens W5455]